MLITDQVATAPGPSEIPTFEAKLFDWIRTIPARCVFRNHMTYGFSGSKKISA